MIAAVLFLQIALGVYQNYWLSNFVRTLLTALISAVSIATLYLLSGVPLAIAVILGLAAIAVTILFGFDRTRILSSGMLLVLVAVALLGENLLSSGSTLTDSALVLGEHHVSLSAVIASVAGLLMLGPPTNDLCRSVLIRMRAPNQDPDRTDSEPRSRRGWRLMIGNRALAAVHQDDQEQVMHLRGGRFIGPLERWLVLLLAVSGQATLIAALVAAKGIGRFPELSADRARGAKAEEFLVGSLVSWGFAGLVALLLSVLLV